MASSHQNGVRCQHAEFANGLQALVLARHHVLEAEIWMLLSVCGSPQHHLPDFPLTKHTLKNNFAGPTG